MLEGSGGGTALHDFVTKGEGNIPEVEYCRK